MRPYSHQYWLEKRRRMEIERRHQKRVWFVGIVLAGLVVCGLLVLAGIGAVPREWKDSLRQKGENLMMESYEP